MRFGAGGGGGAGLGAQPMFHGFDGGGVGGSPMVQLSWRSSSEPLPAFGGGDQPTRAGSGEVLHAALVAVEDRGPDRRPLFDHANPTPPVRASLN